MGLSHFFRSLFQRKSAPQAVVQEQQTPSPAVEIEKNFVHIHELPTEVDHEFFDAKWPADPPTCRPLHPSIIVGQNADLIRKLYIAIPMSDEELDDYLLPVINNLAAYVHLLSASESHHHRGRAGLFVHSLETALFCANNARNKIFDVDVAPKIAFENRSKWILASALTGLLHDIGKVVTDITVRSKDGVVWLAMLEPLDAWLERLGRPEYTFSWEKNRRYSDHISNAALLIRKILPQKTLEFLIADPETGNNAIVTQLMKAISGEMGESDKGLLTTILTVADGLSVRADNARQHLIDKRDKLITSDVAQAVLDIIKKLVADQSWTVNGKHSEVFVTSRGVFIDWTDLSKLYSRLNSQLEKSIPQNKQALAEILVGTGVAEIPPTEANAADEIYWPLCPIVREEFSQYLKISHEKSIFQKLPPDPIAAVVYGLSATDEEIDAWKRSSKPLPRLSEREPEDENATFSEEELEALRRKGYEVVDRGLWLQLLPEDDYEFEDEISDAELDSLADFENLMKESLSNTDYFLSEDFDSEGTFVEPSQESQPVAKRKKIGIEPSPAKAKRNSSSAPLSPASQPSGKTQHKKVDIEQLMPSSVGPKKSTDKRIPIQEEKPETASKPDENITKKKVRSIPLREAKRLCAKLLSDLKSEFQEEENGIFIRNVETSLGGKRLTASSLLLEEHLAEKEIPLSAMTSVIRAFQTEPILAVDWDEHTLTLLIDNSSKDDD